VAICGGWWVVVGGCNWGGASVGGGSVGAAAAAQTDHFALHMAYGGALSSFNCKAIRGKPNCMCILYALVYYGYYYYYC